MEDFLGFYEWEDIKSVTVVNAIKNILLRFKLSLQHCRGQRYNGASNIMGTKSVVGNKLLVEQIKALVTHCQGHCLRLAVKDLTACFKILCDTISTMREICVLVKYSLKRGNISWRMQKSFEGNADPDTDKFLTLEKLCPTPWTVRASCFQKIIDNYCLLLKLWDEYLKESRSRIVGCKTQNENIQLFLCTLPWSTTLQFDR